MTKPDLIRKVASNNGISIAEATNIVDSTLRAVTETLKSGENVDLHGFGSFKAVAKPARIGRNPSTGQAISLPAKTVVKFVPAKAMKDTVNA